MGDSTLRDSAGNAAPLGFGIKGKSTTGSQRESNEVKHDPVYSPTHYTAGDVETIDKLRAVLSPEQFYGFCIGNVLKYTDRAGNKDGAAVDTDLGKARWYARMARGDDPRNDEA